MRDTEISESLVKQEFYKSTERFNVITSWIGLFLNIIWCISDYYIINECFVQFLLLRIAVSSISGLLLMLRKIFNINIYVCIFVLALGISVQNAYMWSVMDIPHFQKHAFAYMVLFIGVGMLVLWEQKVSIALVVLTIIANIVFYLLNSHLSMNEFLINGGLITLTVLIFCVFQIRTRYRFAFNDIRIRLKLELSKRVIEEKHAELVLQKIEIQNQKDRLEVKNRETTDSINYAKNIQDALLPTEEDFKSYFKESFVFFKPKDIVSGDFYWIYEKDNLVFYATADCTGHGVPGGFMTMLGLSFLDDIIEGQKVQDPALALDLMRDKIISALNQTGNFGESKDGMDITICCIDKIKMELNFASANNDLYIVKNNLSGSNSNNLFEYKANRQPVGFYHLNKPFSKQTILLEEGDCIYTFTDGYADQFGGPKSKKFRYKQFQEILSNNSHLNFNTQKNILSTTLDNWKNDLEQIDDILVIGVKV
jgi:phosphoserine phosphatase RsbU/P